MKAANSAPIYAVMYDGLAEIARQHGYALAVHGSMARDCDLICIPWTDAPHGHMAVIDAIVAKYAWKLSSGPTLRPQGRVAYTLHAAWGTVYLDLQFMPCMVS